jgi:hypothetical protein
MRAKTEMGLSAQALTSAMEAVDLLLKKMTEMGYTDPSRSTVTDYRQLECELVQQGLIPSNTSIWDELSRTRRTEAFFGVCRLFKERFADFITTIRDVEEMLEQAVAYAAEGKLVPAIDENQIPFRQFLQATNKNGGDNHNVCTVSCNVNRNVLQTRRLWDAIGSA